MEPIVLLVTAACWLVFITVWVVAAWRDRAVASPPVDDERARRRTRAAPVILAILVVVGVLSLASSVAEDQLPTEVAIEWTWLQPIGLVVLAVSTAFTVWARLALGTSWSVGPKVIGDRRLRTSGPYAVTRHPIYTGVLGMLIGTALVSGAAASIGLVLMGLVLIEVKIQREERLLLATFPDEYPGYRRRVPQLIPGLSVRHR